MRSIKYFLIIYAVLIYASDDLFSQVIGDELKWTNISNMSLNNNGNYTILDDKRPGAASINGYFPANGSGYYTFKIENTNSRFNFVLNPYDTAVGLVPNSMIIVKKSIIKMHRNNLPDSHSEEFSLIDVVNPEAEGDSLEVVQKEFVIDDCEPCHRLPISGIEHYYGKIYSIENGVSIKKGWVVSAGDQIKMAWNNGILDVYKEETNFSTINYPLNNPFLILTGVFEEGGGPRGPLGLIDEVWWISLSTQGGGGFIQAKDGCSCPDNNTMNWTETVLYDEAGSIINSSREYFDYRGMNKQTQIKNLTENKVIITQSLYDIYGRRVGESLPAPTDQICFCYKSNFMLKENSNYSYNYTDFDVPNYTSNTSALTAGERDNPKPVRTTTPYNLGWYYSNLNSWENYVPTTSTPYSRIVYSKVDPSSVLKVAKPGNQLNCGSGHESYNFKMATIGELNNVFGVGSGWRIDHITDFSTPTGCGDVIRPTPLLNTDPLSLKSINVDENGIENVTFYDLTGNLIAKCLSGKLNGTNVKTQAVQGFLAFKEESKRYVDIHLPEGCENSLVIQPQPNLSYYPPAFRIIDLKKGEYVRFNGVIDIGGVNNNPISPNLPPGYYRIMVSNYDPQYNGAIWTNPGVVVKQNLNYYNFSLNYYDYANRLKASISPNGYDDSYLPEYEEHNPSSAFFGISVINSNESAPPNFAQGKTWSFAQNNFVNTLPLNIGSLGSRSENNIHINLTFSDRVSVGFGTSSGPTVGSISKGNYLEPGQQTLIDVPSGIPPDSIIVRQKEVCFFLKTELINSEGTMIEGTTLTSTNLRCVVKYTQSGTEYHSWSPVRLNYNLSYSNTSEIGVEAPWKKIKVIDFHPLSLNLGEEFSIYESLINEVVVSYSSARLSSGTSPARRMADLYRYDSWSQLLNKSSHDDGITDYIYTADGKPKLTQNMKQDQSAALQNIFCDRRYSFALYDIADRPLLTGEYDPTLVATGNNRYFFESYQEHIYATSPIFGGVYSKAFSNLPDVYNSSSINMIAMGSNDNVSLTYDLPDPNFYVEVGSAVSSLPVIYTQRHLAGRLSYSYNNNKKTWYSYDERGRIEWVVQKYKGINPTSSPDLVKSFRYRYDAAGNVSQTVYNEENAADKLCHTYQYDADMRLSKVFTQRGITATPVLQAKYHYYKHGPLKRAEIGDGLQGLDYVYTVNGWLKSINGPEMDRENPSLNEINNDPGKDGYEGLHFKDMFGLALDYFYNDYTRDGTYIQSDGSNMSANQYNGILKAQRWQTRTTFGGLTYANAHLIYNYQYDKQYQLTKAIFGQIVSNGSQNLPQPTALSYMQETLVNDYMVDNITYDYNGNLTHLKRKAYGSNDPVIDDLTYYYESCNNRLTGVTDAIAAQPFGQLEFKPGQSSSGGNYLYNELGELVSETSDNKKYEYNVNGNITVIRKKSDNSLIAEYKYDESGMRVEKFDYINNKRTLYVRDMSGQVVATFDKVGTGNTNSYGVPTQWNIYAHNRIGVLDKTAGIESYIYELTDHLGNVRTTFKKSVYSTISTDYDNNLNPNWFEYGPGITSSFYSSPSPPNNNFVWTQGAGSIVGSGPGSKFLRVKYGDNISVAYTGYWEFGAVPPNVGMRISLVDKNGQPFYYSVIMGNMAAIYQVPDVNIPLTGNVATWNPKSQTFSINHNFPEMYIKVYPYNAAGGAIVYFDDLSITFNNGGYVTQPDMLSMADYYPQGGVMPGLNYTSSYDYKYGYQGQFAEKDKESNESFFELRNYDPLIARFKTNDPYGQYWSPYNAMGNNHPNMIDPTGGIAYDDIYYNSKTGSTTIIETADYFDRIYYDGGFLGYASQGWGKMFFPEASIIPFNPENNGVYLKPPEAYNYSKEVIDGKFSDDANYVINGGAGNAATRIMEVFVRDWDKAPSEDKVDLVVSAAGPLIRIGRFVVPKELFHRAIKGEVLKAAGKVTKFEKVVGKNPDIGVQDGKIILNGVGKYKGKSINTGLNAEDFFQ